jgi:hypothetical protein
MIILIVIYSIIALVFGYFTARDVWRHGTADYVSGPCSLPASLFFGITWGACWPLLIVLGTLSLLFHYSRKQKLGQRIGHCLFGECKR